MAEIIQRTGTWTFDGETVRIVPATEKHVHPLRKALAQVASGRLPDASDPYQLPVERDWGHLPRAKRAVEEGVAEYFVDEVRHALLLDQIPDTPCDRYLLPGPPPLRSARGRRPQYR